MFFVFSLGAMSSCDLVFKVKFSKTSGRIHQQEKKYVLIGHLKIYRSTLRDAVFFTKNDVNLLTKKVPFTAKIHSSSYMKLHRLLGHSICKHTCSRAHFQLSIPGHYKYNTSAHLFSTYTFLLDDASALSLHGGTWKHFP